MERKLRGILTIEKLSMLEYVWQPDLTWPDLTDEPKATTYRTFSTIFLLCIELRIENSSLRYVVYNKAKITVPA